MSAFIEHAAVRVNDLEWHIRFFREVLEMTIEKTATAADGTQNVWLKGGIQLTWRPGRSEKSSLDHLGVVTQDLGKVMEKLRQWSSIEYIPDKPVGTWIRLPEGLTLEMFAEKDHSVEKVLAIDKR